LNLQEALEAAGIEVRPGASAEEIWMCCPFCQERGESPDGRFRFGVNLRTGQAQCFNCEWKGRGEYTFNQIQRSLSTGAIEAAQEIRKKHRHKEKPRLPEDFELLRPPTKETDYWNNKAYKYVRSRGVSEGQIQRKHIGYSLVKEMAYRVVFPVYVRGKLKGLVGRDMTGKQDIPYKNSVGGKALYNVQDKPQKTVVLMEGIFDTLVSEKPARKIDMDVNGLLGHDLTDDQLELLEPYKTIILWLDPDEAGLKGLMKIPQKIPKNKVVKVVLPMGFLHKGANDVDPSELEATVIVKRLLHAKHLNEGMQLSLRAWSAFDE
jgi:DNA primase